jgi:hypothetical protein
VRAEAARSLKEAQAAEGGWTRGALSALRSVVAWLLGVPSKLAGLARMSRAEWSTLLSRMWASIKAEAHHYWARSPRCRRSHSGPALSRSSAL